MTGGSPGKPRLSGWRWSQRFGLVVLSVCVLAWAWQRSGMGEAGRLWENRTRAVDYVLGQPAPYAPAQERLAEAERMVRAELQAQMQAELRAGYSQRDEAMPSLMSLIREAQAEAEAQWSAMPESERSARLDAALATLPQPGARRGGYFPPETDPRAIFGEPERVLSEAGWAARTAAWVERTLGSTAGSLVAWGMTAVLGEGYVGELLETVAIAVWGTLIAVMLAVPASLVGSARSFSILATGRGVPSRLGRWLGRFSMRRVFDVSRGFNEIVLAMIFVAVLGLGPLPGVLALVIHTFGVLGKVFAEAIDTIDPKPVEGVSATGAAPGQVVAFAVLPQVMPYVVSQSLLRFESNVRGATILGVVGAGGIGQLLMDKFGAYEFGEVATIMALVIVVVTLIDFGCGRLMRSFV